MFDTVRAMKHTFALKALTQHAHELEPGNPASMFSVIALLAIHISSMTEIALRPECSDEDRKNLLKKIQDQSTQIADVTVLLDHLVRAHTSTDVLTRVHNRAYFDTALDAAMKTSSMTGGDLALLAFDIDHFKKVNDTYGHAAGDQVLRVFARQIQRGLKDGDLVARYGGEEFMALLSGVTQEQALKIAERLRAKVQSRPARPDMPAITVSIGVTMHTASDTAEAFKARADRALYQAKANGRNGVAHVSSTPPKPKAPKTCRLARTRAHRKLGI